MKSRLIGAVSVSILSLCISSVAESGVIDAYFSMNYVQGGLPGSPGVPEVMLLDITYVGGGGGIHTTAMPAFGGLTPLGSPATGLPDGAGLAAMPTYTTVASGDGETTRTIGATVPIDWNMAAFPFPSIDILSITVDAPSVGGIWTASLVTPYTVGLIPAGTDTELISNLAIPQGDIYDTFAGVSGNPVGTVISTTAPVGFEDFIGIAFGDFIFAAASPVPVPPAIWLFGSGLIGLIGIARRKKS